jgi:Ca-activated chloride channel family protein
MELFFRFAYTYILYGGLVILAAALWYRIMYYNSPFYVYPVTHMITESLQVRLNYKKILSFLRFIALAGLILLAARPQLIDQQSKINVEGIDIMMAIDVSGSMQLFDSLDLRRPRIDIAKEEAIKFIKKRDNDPIGLVLFAEEAVTRCPVTLDKKMLESIISSTELGIINPQGTMLSKGLLMAVNRLKKSTAKSRIIILLTDGEPTPGDEKPEVVAALAKKYGIKIYTIGIGGQQGGYIDTAFGIQAIDMPFNTEKLSFFAQQTGGRMFHVTKPEELARIYEIINQLEKTEYETNIFQKYEDVLMPYLAILMGLLSTEIILSQIVWFGL